MDLVESCKQIGIVVDENSSYDQIIENLKQRPDSDRMDIQLVLGVAQQESGDFEEAYKVFCNLAEEGSIAGLFQKATYLYDGRIGTPEPSRAAELMELGQG